MSPDTKIHWGAATAVERGPVIPLDDHHLDGNAVGLDRGAYGFQRAIAKILHDVRPGGHGTVDPRHTPNLQHTKPVVQVPPNPSWLDPDAIVTFDPWGYLTLGEFGYMQNGTVLPTIAITRSRFKHLGIEQQLHKGKLHADDTILRKNGTYEVTDINIDPVWYMPGVAKRLGMNMEDFRLQLVERAKMPPELLRADIDLLLPPIDGPNVHVFGDLTKLSDPRTEVGARSHDYCRDGDNGARRCTCAESKQYAIEELIKLAQAGGVGILVMNPEEGRNHGSVIKHLVYNKRETQQGGDRADRYFECTEEVAGGEDARMHWAKADPFHWLNARTIHHWFSESPHKKEWMERYGIQIVHQIALPEDRIPDEAKVEMDAKRTSGYGGELKSA